MEPVLTLEIKLAQHIRLRHSSKHWIQLLQNSKRTWKLSTAILSLLSVGGGLAANYFWLNPPTDTSGSAGTATKTQTVTSDVIQYRYGQVELEVTATAGKIEKIVEKQASTSRGWETAVPVLNKAAMDAQGANFGNLSGATFITEAYKQALSNALSKLQ
jgi:uncharacterized protein with FMN-binding domain